MVNKLFDFSETTKISFSDVNSNDWFYREVQKAFKAGYITGISETQFAPNSNLTREQAAVIIARLLNLKGDAESAEVFKDMNKISSWALKLVGAAAKAEIIKGYTEDKTFRPQNSITRAEAVVTLNRTIESKDLTIDEADTVVKNKTVRNLYITKNVGNGEVTLKNVTVTGELLVEGGGLNTVTIEDSKINMLTINKKDGKVRILLKGDSEVDLTSILSGATLEQKYLTGDGFNDVVVEEDANSKQTVTIKADIKELSFKATIKVDVKSGEIESLIIDDAAEGLVIDLGNDVKVLSAELNSKVSFKGNGTIKRVEVNADGVTFEKKPTKIIVAAGVKQPKIIIPPNSTDSNNQYNIDIAAAKTAIEGATYTATQAEATGANDALTKAQTLVNELGTELKGTTATAIAGTFAAATAGNATIPTGTNGSYTFTVTINKGTGIQATTKSLTMIIIATPYDSTALDNLDIAAAKTAVEGTTYTATQAEVSDATTAMTKAQALVNALGTQLKGTTATVTTGIFTAATAGDVSTPNGTDGSYSFIVTILKGKGAMLVTIPLTMTIKATPYVPVTGVTLNLTTVPDLQVGTGAIKTSQQLIATVSPADATYKTVIWNSSNNAVAAVNANGLVTATGAGTATITVITTNSVIVLCTVTVTDVTPAPTQYTLSLTGAKISSTPTAGSIDENTPVTVTVSPAAGQTIESFTVDGVEKKAELTIAANEYNFTLTKDTEINSTVKLAQVEISTWTDNVINWVDLDDEQAYIVTIYKDGSTLSSNQVAANSTFYNCSTLIANSGSGMYSASVKAIVTTANDFIDGDFSALSAPKIVNNATFTGAVWNKSTKLLTINLQNVHVSSNFDLTKISYSDGVGGTCTLAGNYDRVYFQPQVEGYFSGKYLFDGIDKLIINLTEPDFDEITFLSDNIFSEINNVSDTISSASGWNTYNSINAGAVNPQNINVQ